MIFSEPIDPENLYFFGSSLQRTPIEKGPEYYINLAGFLQY